MLENIEARRLPLIANLTSQFIDGLIVTREDYESVEKELSLKGNYYRHFLNEECISALARNDAQSLKENLKRLDIANTPQLLNSYPQDMEPHLNELREMAFNVEFLNERYAPDCDVTAITRVVAIAKSFEPYRKKASLFLNKGYSPKEEEACELLRNQLIKKYLQQVMLRQKEAYEKTLTLVWVYKMLCRDSCLNKKMSTEFIRAVEEENYVLLLSCINLYTVMRNAIKRSESFRTFITKELCSIDDFLKIISLPFVPLPCTAFTGEESQVGVAFLVLCTDDDHYLRDFAKHYYYRARPKQSGNNNETKV